MHQLSKTVVNCFAADTIVHIGFTSHYLCEYLDLHIDCNNLSVYNQENGAVTMVTVHMMCTILVLPPD